MSVVSFVETSPCGRAITRPSLRAALLAASGDALEPLTFLDLDLTRIAQSQLAEAGL